VFPRPVQLQPTGKDPQRPRGLRMLTESLIFLALAVTMFRWSAVEGYIISTGSMAPGLLGYHRRVTCPACGFEFTVGAPGPQPQFADRKTTGLIFAQDVALSVAVPQTATCPNCDLGGIDLAALPITEGDQILVHKEAFLWRQLLRHEGPRRWEVAAFRNPEDPTLTYVKRIAGLPGETIELEDGDVYADGELQRKPFARQLGTRVLVHANDYAPDETSADWQPRWLIEDADSSWERNDRSFETHATGNEGRSAVSDYRWVRYEHWIRQGGTHTTSVALENWPANLDVPDPYLSPVEYDAERHRLSCFGALPATLVDRWTTLADDEEFSRALRELYRRSHVAPITDSMSYNVGLSRDAPTPVRDFMLELTLERVRGRGAFAVELTDGIETFVGEFDFGAGEARLWIGEETEPRATAALPPGMLREAVTVQMSTFDRQVVLAVNEEPLFDPVELRPSPGSNEGIRRPARFGVRALDVRVDHIRLFRDVYYQVGPDDRRLFRLGADEFFVLGDNSSVSLDSRHWEHPGVHRDLLVGKPLLVHLPSRSRRLNWGNGRRYIRVPDFARIRYIR
jgi:signal peptidase I